MCIPDAQAVCLVCVCVCVGDEALVWRVLPQGPRSIFTKKAFDRRERRSWISDQAPLVRKISLKGKKLTKDQPQKRAAVAAAQKTFRQTTLAKEGKRGGGGYGGGALCGDLAHPRKVEQS